MTALSPGASPPPVEMATRMRALESGGGIGGRWAPPGGSAILAAGPLDQPQHFAGCGVAATGPLGEHHAPVHHDLENAAGGLEELDTRVREGLPELGRQTGGPGL